MQIKFSFRNQKRKTNVDINTVEELRKKATQIFGDQATYCDFMYEDEDNELVSIIDNDDFQICLEEAESNGQKCVNIILKLSSPDTKKARSVSKKIIAESPIEAKQPDLKNFDSEESSSEGTEEIDLAEIEAIKSSSDEETKELIKAEMEAKKLDKIAKLKEKMEIKKAKIESKIQEKLARMEAKKQEKLQKIQNGEGATDSDEQDADIPEDKPWMKHIPHHHRMKMRHMMFNNKHRDHSHNHSKHNEDAQGEHSHEHGHHHHKHHGCKFRGIRGIFGKAIGHLKHGLGMHHASEHGRCHQQLHGLFKELRENFKNLKHCPDYLNEVIKIAAPQLKEVVNNTINQVKASHPELEEKLATILASRDGRSKSKSTEKHARREARIEMM